MNPSHNLHGLLRTKSPLRVRLDRADDLHGAGMRGRCSPVSGTHMGRLDRGSLGPTRDLLWSGGVHQVGVGPGRSRPWPGYKLLEGPSWPE
jgi:hypothetical protein